ncbi:DUF2079 domain-containing protein [Yinghuangia seranimata]|uniref:DUF2079 domain-containing protein n=1 Tax=Yinghuangia seranimata TaxID=408067 RepID=UPI00248CDE59|nr:DUF2079 domain-containing protein [Yinghuangia seranimata]MDI2130404.1 DUF2079 domain-containing protein [Yinghuangia seranimata]
MQQPSQRSSQVAPIPVPGQRGERDPGPPRDTRRSRIPGASRVTRELAARPTPYLLGIAFFGLYALISLLRFRHVENPSWDLAIFEQAVKGYAHLDAPTIDVRSPGLNQLGNHFSPILAVLAPFYRIFPSPLTLLIAQAALFALAVVPITRMASTALGTARGAAIGIAFGLSWGVQRAVEFDFHEVAFAVPLLAFSMEKLVERRWTAAVLWALPLLLVKEDMGLTVGALGIYLLTQRRWRLGAALMVLGALAMALTVYVVIPGMNPDGVYEEGEKAGGGSLFGLFGGFPQDLFWPFLKTKTYLWVFGVVGFLALRSPIVILAVPTLAWRMLSDTPNHWGQDWHYNAVLMPIVFAALVDAVRAAGESPAPWQRTYARNLPGAVLAASLALCAYMPAAHVIEPDEYKASPRLAAANQAVRLVKKGSTVETDLGLISQLPSRATVYWIGATGKVVPDYVAVNRPDVWDAEARRTLEADAAQRHPGARYTVVYDNVFVILKRVG